MAHWYTADRQPMHEVEGKNGNMRSTTIRDARELNLFPSVTTIIGILDKPGLNQWIQTEIAKAAADKATTNKAARIKLLNLDPIFTLPF